MTDSSLSVAAQFGADDVEILARERAYDGFFKLDKLRLRHRKFAGGWSEALARELVMRRAAVGVLLYDPQLDAVALVEQFRTGVIASDVAAQPSPWLLELVAGLIDTDETPAAVAQREALEEAGCNVQALEPMYDFFMSPGGSNEYIHLYCARSDLRDVGGIHGLPEEHEDIRVHVVSWDDVSVRLQRNQISNALTIISLQWLQLHRARLRQQWR